MPILGGYTRFRKHQIGKQSALSTAVAATRVLPYEGPIEVDLGYQDDEADTGTLDPAILPYRTASEITSTHEGRLNYNDAPYLFAAAVKGGVTATGATAKAWSFQAASETADNFDYFTDEWGDDVTGDWFQAFGGIVESLELTGDEDLGPLEVSAEWIFAGHNHGSNASPAVPTTGLTVDTAPTRVMLADAEVFLDDAFGSIGTTKLSDAVHGLTLTIENEIDRKRFANGSNTRFELAAYGRGTRTIELELTLAKTSAVLEEVDDWDADTPIKRFVELRFADPAIITGSTPYSLSIKLPIVWREREDDDLDNNSVIKLKGTGFYDTDLGYPIKVDVVNTLATL